MDAEHSVSLLAETQHGLITRRQALELGLSERAVDRRLASGRWEPVFRGVFRLAGTERTWRQRVEAGCLKAGPGAVASHRSAANLRGWPALARWIEITVPGHRQVAAGGMVVHRSIVPPEDRETLDRISTTSAVRTLIDLAGEMPKESLGMLLDHALGHRFFTHAALERRLDELGTKGRRGAGILAELLGARPASIRPIEAGFESRLLRELSVAGLPTPEPQHSVMLPGGRIAYIDFAYPDIRLAIEADSYRHHSTLTDWSRDRARNNDLVAMGWAVLPMTWDLLTRDPSAATDQIRRALQARREKGGGRPKAAPSVR